MENINWDFKDDKMSQGIHGICKYPAMLMPNIVEKIINDKHVTIDSNTVFLDPFVGSGTTLAAANTFHLKQLIGCDLNPLALKITEAKLSNFQNSEIESFALKLKENFSNIEISEKNIEISGKKMIKSWFSESVICELAKIKTAIDKEKDETKLFLEIAFADILRSVSYTRTSEFKLYKMKESALEKFNPDVSTEFFKKIEENLVKLNEYSLISKNNDFAIHQVNSSKSEEMKIITDSSVDIVITSPPYGDSKTTVAYGQFSRLANEWLEHESPEKVDNNLMGGKKSCNNSLSSPIAKKVVDAIKAKSNNLSRHIEVETFLSEYEQSIKIISDKIKHDGVAVFIVANRTVAGVDVPLNDITIQNFGSQNFKKVDVFERNIINKRMPSSNSPSNKANVTGKTMSKEYIIVMKKI